MGEEFAVRLLANGNIQLDHAAVIVLSGELGAGKTTFVQGFLKGAGVRGRATSPTFVIMRHYHIPHGRKSGGTKKSELKNPAFSTIVHMDAYRLKPVPTATSSLKDGAHLAALKFQDIISDPHNIVIIEWGERIKGAIPKGALVIQFHYDKKEGVRKIAIS